ncbi:MAG: glycosyltransferase family 4 protein [Bacteroidota bacterium]
MKIVQIIQKPQLRGAEIFACQLSKELSQRGHSVLIVSLFKGIAELPYQHQSLNRSVSRRFYDIRGWKLLSRIITDFEADIVQANAGDTLKYAAISRLLFRWEATLIFRNANKISGFIRNNFHKRVNSFFLEQVDFVISVSENCRQDLIHQFPTMADISVTGTIGTYASTETLRQKLNDVKKIWVNVGSFVPEKNHQFLIDLFASYSVDHGNSELWLIGNGSLRADLELQASRLQIENQVKFFGYRNDAVSLIKQADLMVITSKVEGLPGVILEALSCGIPVVTTAVGGIPEVIERDKTGIIIPLDNKEKALELINRVLSDKRLYSNLVRNGKKMVDQKFLMTDISTHFEKIYLRILDAKNKNTAHN